MIDSLIQRAQLLFEQNKFEEAKSVLMEVLSKEPNNANILALYAEVSLELKNVKKANELIDQAIALTPDLDYLHYIKARILLEQEKYDESEKHLQLAINLDSNVSQYFSLWAAVKLSRKQYSESLDLANQALELDPKDISGLNIRSTALLKLKKHDESFKTIEGSLNEDPNNSYTHANLGWNLLEKGDSKKALKHFKEALNIDPNFEYARSGMAEALKARYFFYRLFLKYVFWIGNLTSKYQWGVIIGFYVAFKVIRMIARNNSSLQPFLIPIIITLSLIAFSTWIITPLSNLLLRINAYGRYLLTEKEISSSNYVGISALAFLSGLIGFVIDNDTKWLTIAALGFAMMLPLGSIHYRSKFKYALPLYSLGLLFVGILAVITSFQTGEPFNGYSTFFLFGFIAYQWVANFIIISSSNR